jgi:DNA topoisomerase-3
MVVRREREVRSFVKTPFYRVLSGIQAEDKEFSAEFRAVEGSNYYNSRLLYKENGFSEKTSAVKMITELTEGFPEMNDDGSWTSKWSQEQPDRLLAEISHMEKKKETKNPPLLYNLAELQNDCSRMFKISPDETLKITQELYEKKMVTYPRTDARVLSTAVAKEIYKNIKGLQSLNQFSGFVAEILEQGSYKNIAKTRYVNDSQITDHYAIVPTGQGLNALGSLTPTAHKVYNTIVKRFLSIFFPAAEYRKVSIVVKISGESFFASFRVLEKEGYLKIVGTPGDKSSQSGADKEKGKGETGAEDGDNQEEDSSDGSLLQIINNLKKGMKLPVNQLTIKEGETAPPKRYNSGALILAMENAGQLIEDEELRAQIKGSGIGTSATRAEILNKLVNITYLNLNKKTQIITPTLLGELIYDVVNTSIKSLLNAELTASWEKGLTYVADGQITKEEYTQKLDSFVAKMVLGVKQLNNHSALARYYSEVVPFYKK